MATSRFERPSAAPIVLLLPDVDADRIGYWQDQWAASRLDCMCIDMGAARRPDRNSWVTKLDQAIRGLDAPILLVGHGTGALTIAWWNELLGQELEANVVGALLIAPPDPAAAEGDERMHAFAPLPRTILPFPSLVVASENDGAISIDRAFSVAREWGAGFARFGACGHFGTGDGLGAWPQGEQLLDSFIDLIEAGPIRATRSDTTFFSGWLPQSDQSLRQLRR
jgi:predicted alpha/beta hydrolase family esterase